MQAQRRHLRRILQTLSLGVSNVRPAVASELNDRRTKRKHDFLREGDSVARCTNRLGSYSVRHRRRAHMPSSRSRVMTQNEFGLDPAAGFRQGFLFAGCLICAGGILAALLIHPARDLTRQGTRIDRSGPRGGRFRRSRRVLESLGFRAALCRPRETTRLRYLLEILLRGNGISGQSPARSIKRRDAERLEGCVVFGCRADRDARQHHRHAFAMQ